MLPGSIRVKLTLFVKFLRILFKPHGGRGSKARSHHGFEVDCLVLIFTDQWWTHCEESGGKLEVHKQEADPSFPSSFTTMRKGMHESQHQVNLNYGSMHFSSERVWNPSM